MSRSITSVVGLIRKVSQKKPSGDQLILYRGHADKNNYKLEPSVFRDPKYLQNEDRMFRELIASNPYDFSDDRTTFEKLVRMQHHSLPTRLLDLTSNPLMALYFACNDCPKNAGEVIMLTIEKDVRYFYDGDTTSVIANLALMDKRAKNEVASFTDLSLSEFNDPCMTQLHRLLHFIREEKPYFLPKIRPSDIRRIICVKSKMSNSRIVSQAGSFLLFGHSAKLVDNETPGIGIDRIPISGKSKKAILKELDALNINDSTVFPFLENSAKYIRNKYKSD